MTTCELTPRWLPEAAIVLTGPSKLVGALAEEFRLDDAAPDATSIGAFHITVDEDPIGAASRAIGPGWSLEAVDPDAKERPLRSQWRDGSGAMVRLSFCDTTASRWDGLADWTCFVRPNSDYRGARHEFTGFVSTCLRRSHVLLHAAVVESPNGRRAILIGDRGAGKSTLAFLLNQAGFAVLTDEVAFIDPETGSVGGMTRYLNVARALGELAGVRSAPSTPDAHDPLSRDRVFVQTTNVAVAATGGAQAVVTPRPCLDPRGVARLSPAREAMTYELMLRSHAAPAAPPRVAAKTLARLADRCELYDFVFPAASEPRLPEPLYEALL